MGILFTSFHSSHSVDYITNALSIPTSLRSREDSREEWKRHGKNYTAALTPEVIFTVTLKL